ncbi:MULTISPECIES: 1-phosphofructokinase family hexose kinase [Thermocrispum]|uniref:1-phosphofructokinase family hexose kinase n=2 Tax=Thermocrispum agreste TaxID=37925 RepID=A0ABD6FEK8_9PSEU
MAVILTVTPNTAWDVTYWVDELVRHASARVRSIDARAGGKGVNVARVLHAAGHDVLACGFVGGVTGEQIRAELRSAGLPEAMTPIAGESRKTVTVVDSDATVLLEPGPTVTAEEWSALVTGYRRHLADAAVVVLSGSLPPGVPPDGYAELGRLAADAGVPVVLDSSGDALRHGLRGRPAVVKPNSAELATVASGDPRTAAAAMREAGAGDVVVSLGADGLLAVTGEGVWRAVAEPVQGNPTGAGDAVVAALAVGLATGRPWPERLAEAAAMGGAAVAAPLAGDVDKDTYHRLRAAVSVRKVEETSCH